MPETLRSNERRPLVYWDVEVVDSSADRDILVERLEYVVVLMYSDADEVALRDVNDQEVATYVGTEDTHATFTHAGIDILNITTREGRGVTLYLRPAGR